MGTVGLSFGSPTSGAGFNVSTTVSEIVSNLQNVETPWKNQLSSLESQDTVLSSLGTLYSNLTNDISSLTDFTGVMSLKEGSSSNNDILELTAADSSAAEGTYTVSVNSLATTATGFMTAISSSSDTLTGSMDINGTTIDVPDSSTGDDNITGLANAVNSAGIGVTATVLTDTTGSRLVLTSNTSGTGGSIAVTANSITDSTSGASLSYTSQIATGANASLTVNGISLQSSSNTVSGLIPGVTFQLLGTTGTGDTIQVVIANDNSAVESTVTQFVTDYNSLVSAMNAQETTDTSGNSEPLFGSPTLSLLQQQLLSSINYQSPNGFVTGASSASDTLTGSITIGSTTIQMSSLASGSQNLNGLASAINSGDLGVTANVVNNGSGPQLVLVSNISGSPLSATSNLADGTTSLTYDANTGGMNALTGLGISMNNDGTISLDETSLDSVLNSDYSGVLGFFQDANSWGMTFSTMLNNAGASNTVGVLALAEKSNSNVESSLNADVSKENLEISAQQSSLTTELNSANEILQELPAQLNSVNELYSAISGFNENPNG
ncbi:flagellar filament capping protein FliD [Terracidiphilus gabretensis]|uniref:flagellar filament capping protein FliD n=1 Tax=Terracidiphilus gabretensis TaxID=1577687 RepID=UPI00071B2901|nr:flagellar filament capping protein FliD [Terracidiphilus gabretensis]